MRVLVADLQRHFSEPELERLTAASAPPPLFAKHRDYAAPEPPDGRFLAQTAGQLMPGYA